MKPYQRIILATALMLIALTMSGKVRQQKVYLFGLAATFNDSLIYITDIQEIDTAWVDDKTKFLMSRDAYSYQLRDYLSSIGSEHMTCITFFATKKKQIDKKYAKVKKRYNSGKHNYTVKQLTETDFAYRGEQYTQLEEQLMKRLPKQKKDKKNKAKDNKPKGSMPPGGPSGGQKPPRR